MATKKNRVEFTITDPKAKQVILSGTFNEWSETADPMKKDKTGTWRKVKMLPAGRHEYKFIVDGTWTLDPQNTETVPNEHGTANNILKL
ncbi:MAG: glycogen-binding domain-containing protein [Desulfobacterales bacterium]|nr:glycogen-binding domain-containing protein [Desulfobacterales bacterium]